MPAGPSLRHYLDDGFSTKITLSQAVSLDLWEKTIKAPGLSGGGPTDTTTMYNEYVRTQSPKHLFSVQDVEFQAAYASEVLSQIPGIIQVNGLITVTWPDGAMYEFWGWLEEFIPDSLEEGSMPMAACKICISNVDDNKDESPPLYTPA